LVGGEGEGAEHWFLWHARVATSVRTRRTVSCMINHELLLGFTLIKVINHITENKDHCMLHLIED